MRIISGKFKNRTLPTIKTADYRPSTGRFREALFSIISSSDRSMLLDGGRVLDLYAGTGSLSFEAISRGASSSTLVDINPSYLAVADRFAKNIGIEKNIRVICSDVLSLAGLNDRYDIIFADPPYNKGLASKTLEMLINNNLLDDGGIICVETSKKEDLSHDSLEIITDRVYGNSRLRIFARRT